MNHVNVQALADLLKPGGEDSDSEDERPTAAMARMGPGDVGASKSTQKNTCQTKEKPAKQTPKASKDIWTADEVPQGQEYDDIHDPRPQPEYDIVYKQAVTSEDMFLQMGNKTPATSSCESMVVKIQLPDTKIADVKLDVKDTFLDCRTPKYKLGLHLPHPSDGKNGKAQWDSSKHLLSVTLTLLREYDFLNL